MHRRVLCAGLLAIASSMLLMAGTASAHGTASAQAAEGTTCAVHSLPSFVAQGEFEHQASVADVIEVECNPFVYGTGSQVTVTASQLYSRCGSEIEWIGIQGEPISARSFQMTLDADGNATVGLIAGPNCQAGESLISLHMDEGEYNSYTTSFTVLPPNDTALGVTALPSHQVEDSETSSVVTIIEAEFPGAAEASVRIGSEELYRRCGEGVVWFSPEEFVGRWPASSQRRHLRLRIQRPEAGQQRQRLRGRARRALLYAGVVPDRSGPGRKTVHDADDQLPDRIAQTNRILTNAVACLNPGWVT